MLVNNNKDIYAGNTPVIRTYEGTTKIYEKGLPSTYTELQYIQNNGEQYIDTGYVPKDTSGMAIKMSVSDTTDKAILGCRQTSSSNSRWYIGTNYNATARKNTIYAGWNTLDGSTSRATWVANQIFIYKMNFLNDRKRICDDVEYTAISTTLATISHTAYIFCINVGGSTSAFDSTSKVYNVQLSEGSKIVRNFIPCKRKSDNVVGMFDTIYGKFYTNKGTGAFTAGPEV